MNNKTRCIYHLTKIMEHIEDIESVVERYDSINVVFKNKDNKYIINMCLVQIGEHIRNAKDIGETNVLDSFGLSYEKIKKMIGLRNRIVHGYETIDY